MAQAKSHLRVDGADDDTLIADIIKAARQYCEDYQNRAYVTQTWDLWLNAWPGGDAIKIPLPPLQSVTSVKYYDTANAEAIMAPADYFVDNVTEPGRVVVAYGKTWPAASLRPANSVTVRFIAGYGDAAAVPQVIKQAMLLVIGDMYEHRENTAIGRQGYELPLAAKSLLNMNRVWPT